MLKFMYLVLIIAIILSMFYIYLKAQRRPELYKLIFVGGPLDNQERKFFGRPETIVVPIADTRMAIASSAVVKDLESFSDEERFAYYRHTGEGVYLYEGVRGALELAYE